MWKLTKLKDLGKVTTGSTPSTLKPENFGRGYPFIKPPDLHEGRRKVFETETEISVIGAQTQYSRLLPANTPCVVCIGTIGKLGLTTRPSFTNQQINSVIVDQEQHDPVFVYYLLKYSIPEVKQLNGGSASGRENVNKSTFENIEVRVPPLPVQQRIAGILSAYDELIENSQRRIRILEEMARNLYREWFVHFRFPGHENHPRVASPLGEIPQGWEVTNLGNVVEIKKGKNITKKTIRPGDVPVVAGGVAPAYFHDTPNTKRPVITISASGANAGYVNLYHIDVWASDCSYIDSSTTPHIYYIYLWLDHRRSEVTHLQRGSAQPHVYPKDLAQLEAIYVPEQVLNIFTAQVTPIFEMMESLTARMENLRRTRDLLLPRLLSGQVSLSDAVSEAI
ncbi:MAG: restriction endonuclease subunit S [Pseudomonadota bacterium]